MKKLMIALFAMIGFIATTVAQLTPAAKKAPAKTATAASPVKKDGTADMRFKANKDSAKAKGPLKKDGTPDARFKANKKKS